METLVACCNGDRILDEARFDPYTADVEIIDMMTLATSFAEKSFFLCGYAPNIFKDGAEYSSFVFHRNILVLNRVAFLRWIN